MIDRAWKVVLVSVALGSVIAGVVFAEAPRPGGSASQAPTATIATEVCRQTCEADVASVTFRARSSLQAAAGADCPMQPQVVVPCAPYGCDGSSDTCRRTCDADRQCADGFSCNESTHRCVALTFTCDGNVLRGTDGSHRSCAPGPCVGNACQPVTYSCNGNTLRGTDGSQRSCAPGTCVGNACQPVSYRCEGDRYVKGTDGSSHDCFPYECVAATCEHTCNSVDNCVSPYVCDLSRHCIPRPN